MRQTYLNTKQDMDWLREVHLTAAGSVAHRWTVTNSQGDSRRDGPYFGDFTEFQSAVLSGNEDAPSSVDLYESPNPEVTDTFVRWTAGE